MTFWLGFVSGGCAIILIDLIVVLVAPSLGAWLLRGTWKTIDESVVLESKRGASHEPRR